MREGVFSDSDQEARGNLKKNSSSLLSMTKTFIFIDMTSEIGFYKFYSQVVRYHYVDEMSIQFSFASGSWAKIPKPIKS